LENKESDGNVPAATPQIWSESIALVKGSRGTFSINAQPAQVKAICKEAILNFEVELVFRSCFPVLTDRLHMGKVAVIKAATDLKHIEILARIKEDSTYCDNIVSMVSNIHILRLSLADISSQSPSVGSQTFARTCVKQPSKFFRSI
jgi:hypothetical protein